MRQLKKYVFNRYFFQATAAITTNSWGALTWAPGMDILITKARVGALWVPVGGVNVLCPNRWSITGAQNVNLENVADTLPGINFDNDTIWGMNGPGGESTDIRLLVSRGTSITMQGRAYSPAAAFGAADTIEYFMQLTYEEVYNISGI